MKPTRDHLKASVILPEIVTPASRLSSPPYSRSNLRSKMQVLDKALAVVVSEATKNRNSMITSQEAQLKFLKDTEFATDSLTKIDDAVLEQLLDLYCIVIEHAREEDIQVRAFKSFYECLNSNERCLSCFKINKLKLKALSLDKKLKGENLAL